MLGRYSSIQGGWGVKLLARQRHGVELTAFGERALDHARAALVHLEAIRKEAAKATGEEAGSVRIAAFPSIFATVLPPLPRSPSGH
jgi:DNA-binding transcriptional LysR family regulator